MSEPSFRCSPGDDLPPLVEESLRNLCNERGLSPPDVTARKRLRSVGEEEALLILKKIRSTTVIKKLSGYIHYLVSLCSNGKLGDSPTAAGGMGVWAPEMPPTRCFNCGSQYASTSHKRPFSRVFGSGSKPPYNSFSSARHLFTENCSSISRSVPTPAVISPLLAELDKLEFRKAFLILSYLGKNKLEDFVSLDMIRSIGKLQMASFEVELWNAVGHRCISESERRKNLKWETSQTHAYHCHVDPTGATTFKGPFLQSAKTHLQQVLGDDNVLVVKFDDVNDTENRSRCSVTGYNAYNDIAKKGITIGLRSYQFFVFKDGGKEGKKKSPSSSPVKCYFVCMESMRDADQNNISMLHNNTVSAARTTFMHIHMVPNIAKYMARFSLILSKTFKLDVDFDYVHIERIDDIPCKDMDGNIIYNDDGEPMIHTDGTGFISEDLALKVPESIFHGQCSISNGVMQRSSNWSFDGNLIHATKPKYPPLLIQCRLFYNGYAVKGTLLVNKKLTPSTIHIRQSMIKVQADPNISNVRCVKSLEIVSTSNKPKKSFLSKNLIALLHYGGVPTEYFMELLGDALEIVQNIYCNKKAAIRVALNHGHIGGLLVGKMILSGIPIDEPYLKWRLSTLVKEELKGLKAWRLPVSESFYLMGTADPTGSLSPDEVCIILYAMSVAADSWLSFMDQLLTQKADATEKECLRKKAIQLVDIYYDALDAPKTGKKVEVPFSLMAETFPHYMEKATRPTYKSTSVLGLIFDEVNSQNYVCPPEDVWRRLPTFCCESSSVSLDFWKQKFSEYESDMKEALRLDDESKSSFADQIIHKYRMILYDAPELELSPRSREKVFDEALVIYNIVFEYANSYKDPAKFNFAWEVAGDALCALHATKQENNSTMVCLQSVLSELLC